MATVVFSNAFVSINSVDLSDHVKSVTINYSADALEDTAMGATFHTSKSGLKRWSATVEFYQDHASAKVNETIYPLIGSSSLYPAVIKGVSSAGTDNTYTVANGMISGEYKPLSGSVGEMLMTSVTISPGSGFTVTKS